MKPKNNTEVRKAYLRFSGYLTSCIVLAVTIFACFLKTSGTEVKRITEQTLEYDHVYARELALANSVDSVYQYMKLMNTSPKINDVLLQSVVSTRKMNLLKDIQGMDARDCRLYSRLLGNINIFLGVKDSIRLLNIQEEMVKKDLMQCIQDNWKTWRSLSVGPNNKQ